ncbi:hypothetical protein [Candidatus Protofrankia californiensis]|uniref:hypothetical protein n=1 Tax=Candidatus Protofrankia californiensis TaxID=1839754 RepID=UPI0010414AFD|nr:hypothetical protein [Candidatus Protofrankia californiensis]
MRLLPRAGCTAVAVLRRDGKTMRGVRFVAGSFAPLDRVPRRKWSASAFDDDLLIVVDSQPLFWMSYEWIASTPLRQRVALVEAARTQAVQTDVAEWTGSDHTAFWAYLMTIAPPGLTTAFWSEAGVCVGYSDDKGFALLGLRSDTMVTAGSPIAADILDEWADRWRAAGNPGLDDLVPVVRPGSTGDLRVEAVLPGQPTTAGRVDVPA